MIDIERVSGEILFEAPWRATYVLKPDQKVLVGSMQAYGWLSPIIVHRKTKFIIDGCERWKIAADDEKIRKRDKGVVPVLWVDCDEIEAMIMHVRLNRGRGQVQAKGLSALLKKIARSKKYDEIDLRKIFSMSIDEIDLLFDGGLLKTRKISEHTYSRAWVPIELPKGASAPTVNIERPPNADR